MELSVDFIKALEEAWPFKRISAPKHLVDRHNEQFKDNQLVDFAITVDKNASVSEEELWDLMTNKSGWMDSAKDLDFGDYSLNIPRTGVGPINKPPHTGMKKRSITEIEDAWLDTSKKS